MSHVQWYKLAWVDDSIRFIPSRRLIIWWCDDFMSHIRSHMQVEHRMCVCVRERKCSIAFNHVVMAVNGFVVVAAVVVTIALTQATDQQ